MSYRHRDSGLRHGSLWRNERSCEGIHEDNRGISREHSERSNRGRPAGLRGKAIGLYYRDKMRNRDRRREEQELIHQSRPKLIISSFIYEMNQMLITRPYLHHKLFNIRNQVKASKNSETKYSNISDSQFKTKFLNIIGGNLQDEVEKSVITKPQLQNNKILDTKLLDELTKQKASSEYKELLKFRSKLPAYKNRKKILDIINANQVVLISGETGCGKTTQIGQLILDHEIECGRGSITCIACTQPRRISTISVAERVAAERTEELGKTIGYHIRLEKISARSEGSIIFCTTGMLLQFMQTDVALRNYSHIIIDEIHERSTESDFILTLLKLIIQKRPDLKIILMSATLNSEQFSKYYNCPTLHIPGYTYPVEEFYLEDVLEITRFEFPKEKHEIPSNWRKYLKKNQHEKKILENYRKLIESYYVQNSSNVQNIYPRYVLEQLYNPKIEDISLDLICKLIEHICLFGKPGAILIFLPGITDIKNLNKSLLDTNHFCKERWAIYPLHSLMPTVDQKQIFNVSAPGIRKIIIATNIAETSITIEDVKYVIDCGKSKTSNFDVENNLQTLDVEWISQASALQRKGRAGRLQPGICYHLYTKARASTFEQYPLPEIRRTRLEEIILRIKILQIGKVDTFLATVIDPPDPKAISLSLDLLRQLNALDENENLTPLGYHLAKLPLDPQTGKMIILGAMFSCIEPIFAIAASLSYKDAFYFPLEKELEARQKKIELGLNQFSDHIALSEALRIFEEKRYVGSQKSFCNEFFLSWNTLKLLSKMKKQFAAYLYEMKFLRSCNPKDDLANRNSDNKSLIKAIVCAGLYPNIAIINDCSDRKGVRAFTIENEIVMVHPSSINCDVKYFPTPYLTYFLKRKSSDIYLFATTCISPITLIFASPSISLRTKRAESVITILNKLAFSYKRGAEIIQKLHEQLNYILEFKISHPGVINWNSYQGNILMAIIKLLSDNDESLIKRSD